MWPGNSRITVNRHCVNCAVAACLLDLEGVYDFKLRWASYDMNTSGGASPDAAPSLFTALQNTLGLKLQRQKVSVPIIVVDHIDRAPTEN